MQTWNKGEPLASVEVAWLRIEEPDGDGGCSLKVVLAVHDGEWWSEAGDYKGESYTDRIDGNITGWLPFEIPST
jgi:hypothetical protein